jgi:hypothetical protein
MMIRYILIASALGLLALSCTQFYSQASAPALEEFAQVYRFLHGTLQGPLLSARPFPYGSFTYVFSKKLEIGGGRAIYFRNPQITSGQDSTELKVTFYAADGKDLPPISELASTPTLHLGTSVFGLRSVSTKDKVGPEMTFAFLFPSIGDDEGNFVRIYLTPNETDAVNLHNPNADMPKDELGTNAWGVLAIVSAAILIIAFLRRSTKVPVSERLRSEWRAIDSERRLATEYAQLPDDQDRRQERHRSAQESLDRAEQILLRSYEEAIRGEALAGWLAAGFLLLCVVTGCFVLLPGSSHLKNLLIDHYSVSAKPVGDFYDRVRSLEQERLLTIRLAMSIIPFCVTAIMGNFLLSIWNTKAKARRMIQRCLDGFSKSFEAELVSHLEKAESTLGNLEKEILAIQERFDRAQALVISSSQTFNLQVRETVASELGKICIPDQEQTSQDEKGSGN